MIRSAAAIIAGAGVAALLLLAPAFADTAPEPIDVGHSAYVLNIVNGQAPRERPVVIRLNDKVVFEEEVAAGHEAKTTIEFRDGSLFSLGPDAQARIDSFVFNPKEGTGHKTLAVTRGVFRYLSGFASPDQEAKIKVPSGTLGIRGSLVVGIVTDGAPDFLFVAQGKAIFVNDAGSVEVDAGHGIAVGSRHTRPMDPKTMPPAIAAQVLREIAKLLPPPNTVLAQPSLAVLLAEAKANLLSAAKQEQREAKRRRERRENGDQATGKGKGKGGSLAGTLPLLVEAEKLGLFDGKRDHHGRAETLFLEKLGRGRDAEKLLRSLVEDATKEHHANLERSVKQVGHGIELVVVGKGGKRDTTVLIAAQRNPKNAARLLQAAINQLGVGSSGAGQLVSLFADAAADTESCDPEEAQQLAQALEVVLNDPLNAVLLTAAPNALEQVTALLTGLGSGPPPAGGTPGAAPPVSGSSGGGGPPPSSPAFGSFGPHNSTSPAS